MLVDIQCGPCYLKLKRREMVLFAIFIGKHKNVLLWNILQISVWFLSFAWFCTTYFSTSTENLILPGTIM